MGRHGTIAGRKAAQDSKRAAMFTKYARAIIVAAKAGGDPDYNPTLRVAIEKAKGIGMPNDNIKRAVQKGTGELAGETYEELTFEGYGAGGIAVIVEALTDNKNRTASSVRSTFDKYGGNLGTPGCVSYMFARKGVIIIEAVDGVDEDALMETALEAGANDVVSDGEYHEIETLPDDLGTVTEALEKQFGTPSASRLDWKPLVKTDITDAETAEKFLNFIEALEDDDDVQRVVHNGEFADGVLSGLE